MKPDESFDEIGKLLRSEKPDPRPSPGLEARILRALNPPSRSAGATLWPWFILPPALATGLFLLWPDATPSVPPVVRQLAPSAEETPVAPEKQPVVSLAINDMNPLRNETRALQRDAERAGRFLIDCLPSFNVDGR